MLKPRHPCFCLASALLRAFILKYILGPPGVWGSWGEGLFIFRELGCTGNYLGDLRSKLIVLGILGAL